VVRALWEDSWADGALRHDVAADVFTDPDLVRPVQHKGQWFTVDAVHQCEPSPQRTPVLYQAGSSDRGTTFAARHAEVVFVTLSSARRGAEKVRELRRRAEQFGRDPQAIKVLQGFPVLLGRTKAEAEARAAEFTELTSPGGLLAKWCGWVGVDLAAYDDRTPITDIMPEDGRSVTGFLAGASPDRDWTVGDVRDFIATPRRPHAHDRLSLFGTPEQVADRMEEYLDIAGVDGFNLYPCPPTSGVDDICDLLVPELQRRGLFRTQYDEAEQTLRQRYLGAGRSAYAPAADLSGGLA